MNTELHTERATSVRTAEREMLAGNTWSTPAAQLIAAVGVDPEQGLTEHQVHQRRAIYGENTLRSIAPRSVASLIVAQVSSIVVLLLLAAVVIAALVGDYTEAAAILVVIVVNGTLGFLMEWRAVRSMEALRTIGRVESKVLRDGNITQIRSEELVPGDLLLVEAGDVITADARLLQAQDLEVDQSTLTGESLPVAKAAAELASETALAERSNLLHKGTAVAAGTGTAIIVATGEATELGNIAQLIAAAKDQETPLEQRLDALGRRLVWLVLLLGVILTLSGVLAGRALSLSLEVAIALAVAAIPEGLPVVATIALARGMRRMAQQHALVRRLSAVETLGATGTILADKTGTLTENQMQLTELRLPAGVVRASKLHLDPAQSTYLSQLAAEDIDPAAELLLIASLCNNAVADETDSDALRWIGDPTETALLAAASAAGLDLARTLAAMPRSKEQPFSSQTMAMATWHPLGDSLLIAVKGSPEAILEHCGAVRGASVATTEPMTQALRQRWLAEAESLGAAGYRALAIALKQTRNTNEAPYEDLTLLGIAGLQDPPRAGIKQVLERCRSAGINVVMVTGDHPATAQHIAQAVGLIDPEAGAGAVVDCRTLPDEWTSADVKRLLAASVIARATPAQKFQLIEAHQANQHVVAMTGDGVNDAPALKQADIGVAMGLRGTQVAKDAADMVLLDDNLETIVEAVAHGRTTYSNIRKFVVYLMSCNLAEILIVALATLVGAPLPILPLQILFLNLVTDVFPALALGMGRGSPEEMSTPPRTAQEPLMARPQWLITAVYGVILAVTVLAAMAYAALVLQLDAQRVVSVSFCTLAFAQLWHVFNMRHIRSRGLCNDITGNPWVWSALMLCIALILGAVYVPPVADPLALTNPGADGWRVIGVCSLIPVLLSVPLRALLRPPVPVASSRPPSPGSD